MEIPGLGHRRQRGDSVLRDHSASHPSASLQLQGLLSCEQGDHFPWL